MCRCADMKMCGLADLPAGRQVFGCWLEGVDSKFFVKGN